MKIVRRRLLISILAIIAARPDTALAHTVSVGYVFSGPGAVTLWYGSYHATATFNEADVQLVGPMYNQTVAYTLLSSVKPTGLVDGTNNFYSNTAGTALVGTPQLVDSTDGSGGHFDPATQSVVNWQGAIFTGLRVGTYTFTYNPLALPTVEWHPINDVIRTNSFTLTMADVLGINGFGPFGRNRNQRAVGAGLDNAINNGAFNQTIYNLALLSPDALANALTQLSGEVATGAGRSAFQALNPFLALMLDPFVAGRGGPGGGGFGPSGGFGPGWGPNGPVGGPTPGSPWAGPAPADGNGPWGGNGSWDGNGSWNDGWGWPGNGPMNDPNRPDTTAFPPPPQQSSGQPLRQWFDHSWSIWGSGYGGQNQASGDEVVIGSHDIRTTTAGLASGIDYRFTPNAVAGIALSGATSAWSLARGLGGGANTIFQAGAYGSIQLGAAYLSSAVAYGANMISTDRTVTVAGSDRLTAEYTAHSFGSRIESGYRLDWASFGATPYGALQVQSFNAPSYTENASSGSNTFALAFDRRDAVAGRGELGMWFHHRFSLADDTTRVLLRARAAYAHDWTDDQVIGASLPALPGSNFTVMGAGLASNSLLASLGADMRWKNGVSFNAKFDGEFAKGSSTYMGTGTLRYAW